MLKRAKVALVGVGGCGTNILNTVLKELADSSGSMAVNRDIKGLHTSLAEKKLLLEGSSAKQVGDAVRKKRAFLRRFLKGREQLILFAGMGGLTGTFASPLIASLAKDEGLSVLAVVVMPFDFESRLRRECAIEGLHHLATAGAKVSVFSNQALINKVSDQTRMADAFRLVDDEILSLISPLLNSGQ